MCVSLLCRVHTGREFAVAKRTFDLFESKTVRKSFFIIS